MFQNSQQEMTSKKENLYRCIHQCTEAAVQRCSWENVLRKYTADLQENTHAEV